MCSRRVSPDMQMEGYSIAAQKELLVNFAKNKEYSGYRFYIDGDIVVNI